MTNPFKREGSLPQGVIDVSGLFDCERCGETQQSAVYDENKQQIRWECVNDHLNEVHYIV